MSRSSENQGNSKHRQLPPNKNIHNLPTQSAKEQNIGPRTTKIPLFNAHVHPTHLVTKSAEIEQEEAQLEARATDLKYRMETLNKKKWIQFMRKQEDLLRQKAQKELELFTKQLQNELEAKMISMNHEKTQKLEECQILHADLQQKIKQLQEMCLEIQQKSAQLDDTYKKCVHELQMDFDTAIIKQKQMLEFQITNQMQHLMKQGISEL